MRKNLISIIFRISFILLISSSVLAAPAMPRYGINEQTKECSRFFMGDECMSCVMPEGWKMIEGFQCPPGYKEIQKEPVCTPKKTPFCCTIQHSGLGGDCEDVVVNDVEQKCAFVEDINRCKKLPPNWHKAEEIRFWGKVCPSREYQWLEGTLDCEATVIKNDNVGNQKDIIVDKQQKSNIIPIISVAVVILLIIVWFFLMKGR